MSYFTNLEMSSFRDAKMPFLKGGHSGRRGHGHVSTEGVKAIARGKEGTGEGDQAGGGSEDSWVKLSAGSKVCAAGEEGGG
jgi:hypothetical protein